MSDPRGALARYLRQRRELGETELVLERVAAELLGAIDAPPPPRREAPAAPPPAAVPEAPGPMPEPRRAPREGPYIADRAPTDEEIAAAASLPVLAELAAGCPRCDLAGSRTQVVFGEGDANAQIVVVGEAPGADEDRTGRPFVGRAGQLLSLLLLSIGLPREAVYICNVLKCRPPGNRDPRPTEVAACSPYLRRQLQLIAPKAILAVGTFPAQTLLESDVSIGRLRGTVHDYQGIPLVPTYHPAALLRNPNWIRPVWEDLQRLRELTDAPAAG